MKKILLITFGLAIGMIACNPKNIEESSDGESEGKTFAESLCTSNSEYKLIDSYDFSGTLEDYFETHPDWQDNPSKGVINDASYYQRNDRFEFEVLSASMAASECWWKWKQDMPSDKSWKIRADLTVPEVWTSGEDPEYQIGVGLFVGKPEGYTVFEVDFSAIASGSRFVLSQNIQNRRGGDPNYVGIDVPIEKATVDLEIIYCNEDKSLSTYFDGIRVDTQPIDDKGIFNWGIESVFHVGIMAFSEGPACNSDFLSVDNWEVYELK
jgi:hypothetical protein